MAKLEELTELLVSEIKDFEEAVKRLEEIQKAKVGIDISDLKKALADHEAILRTHHSALYENCRQFESVIKKEKIYSEWAVIVIIGSLLVNCIVISYLIFKI